jgi:hypothetical protein
VLDAAQFEGARRLTNHDIGSASAARVPAPRPTHPARRRLKLGALGQRIAVRYHMTGMILEETGGYLRHHVALAGRSDTLFSDDATALIRRTSRGYPRSVSNLAISPSSPPSPPSPPARPPSRSSPRRRDGSNDRMTTPLTSRTQGPAGNQPAGFSHALARSPAMTLTRPPRATGNTLRPLLVLDHVVVVRHWPSHSSGSTTLIGRTAPRIRISPVLSGTAFW